MQVSPSTWVHGTAFVQMVHKTFFADELKSAASFWGAAVVQMQTPDVAEVFEDKLASLKVDGERHIVVLFVEKTLEVRAVIMCRNGQLLEPSAPIARLRNPDGSVWKPGFFTILDTEYIHGHWLAFDCLVYSAANGRRAAFRRDFTERMELVRATLDVDFASAWIHPKPFFPVDRAPGFSERIRRQTCEALGFDVAHDGIIFQPCKGVYPVGANMNLASGRGLKWKPECTLDLVPEKMTLEDIRRIHKATYGDAVVGIRATPWDRPVRPLEFYIPWTGRVNTEVFHVHTRAFEVPTSLLKLKCVSDFSFGTQPIFHAVELDNVPLCADLAVENASSVCEFAFGTDLVPVFRTVRPDKAMHQANKARTVAGVLWQAGNGASLDELIMDPRKIVGRVTVPQVTTVSRVENRAHVTPFDDFIRGLTFEYNATTMVENEFKVVQTKRPRAGMIFPGAQEPKLTNAPFTDVLHFNRVKNMLHTKHGKTEPPVVTTVDLIVDENLRMTATERVVTTKHGKKISFFETNGFMGTRKVAAGSSYVVDMPDVEAKSGYVLRMDSRSESPEFFYLHDFLPDNPAYAAFLTALQSSLASRKRRTELPQTYKGYRFVDAREFEPEVEKNVAPALVRRTSLDPVQTGETVQAQFRGYDQFHDATVTRVHPDGTVDLRYKYSIRALNAHSRADLIPLVVDQGGGGKTVLRVKRRQTYEFPGFRVDLTRTKTIPNFKSTEHRRLWSLTQRCDNCEIEIELVSSVARNHGFVRNLAELLHDVMSCMNLSENSFLFDCASVKATPCPLLKQTLDNYSVFLHGDAIHAGVDPVFVRATRGVSRVVRESDFHATFDVEADAVLGPVGVIADPATVLRFFDRTGLVHAVRARNPWAELDATHVEDYVHRRIFRGAPTDLTFTPGPHVIGRNPCWSNAANWARLCNRMGATILTEMDEDVIDVLRDALFGGGGVDMDDVVQKSRFYTAPLAFGTAVADALVVRTARAWWDPAEICLVWNDVLDLAQRFGTSLFYKRDASALWKEFDGDVNMYLVHVAAAKMAVVVGAVLSLRAIATDACPTTTTSAVDLITTRVVEYARYYPRGTHVARVDLAMFEGCDVCVSLF